MNVVVDTCVWSEALRKNSSHLVNEVLALLLRQGSVVLMGPVRQELLCGFGENARYLQVREMLRKYEDMPIYTQDYETAAAMSNACRKKGIQGSQTDFLICAVSHRLNAEILTVDRDFMHFAKHIPIRLFRV